MSTGTVEQARGSVSGDGAVATHSATSALAPAEQFPVDSLRDAVKHLRRPFTANACKFKVQSSKVDKGWAMVVAHIDARLVSERLNMVLAENWHAEFTPVAGANEMWCALTVDGVTRRDIGEGTGKGVVSDSLKRAAVHFGIGVSVYAIPKLYLNANQDAGSLKVRKNRKGEDTFLLTEEGERVCRARYADWLESHGREAFGDPLDHGDVADSQGDYEAETPAPAVTVEDTPVQPTLDDEMAQALRADAQAAYDELRALGGATRITPGVFASRLSGAKDHDELHALVREVQDAAHKLKVNK